MLSRVAHQLYWYGRYLERVECTARLIRVNSSLLLDLPTEIEVGWYPLVEILGLEELFTARDKPADERHIIDFLLRDRDNPSSLIACATSARENLRTTRDIVPREIWEQTSALHAHVQEHSRSSARKRHDFLTHVVMDANTITGLIYSVMSNDLAYQFMRLGANIERADMTTRILDIRADDLLPREEEAVAAEFENILWMSVLKSLSAYQMYRQHRRTRVTGNEVISYLLQDTRHPRSVTFCLQRIRACLKYLPSQQKPLKTVRNLELKLQRIEARRLKREDVPALMDDIQLALIGIDGALTESCF